jgi:hypothetical protein
VVEKAKTAFQRFQRLARKPVAVAKAEADKVKRKQERNKDSGRQSR